MAEQLRAETVLAAWREVERKLERATGRDRLALEAQAARLRTEYQSLIDAALAHDRPEPPPIAERNA